MRYDLKLTDEELAVISDCLALGQFGKVAPVVRSINSQLTEIRAANASRADADMAPTAQSQG